MKMRKILFMVLSLAAAVSVTSCNQNSGEGVTSNEKKLTHARAEYIGDVEGTDLQRYMVSVWSNKNNTKADNFSNADIMLTMELIMPKQAAYSSLEAGEYTFSATSLAANTIADTENSVINVIEEHSYGGDKSRINGGMVTVSVFKDKYQISGEVTDVKGRTLEFMFYDTIEFVLPYFAFIDFEKAELSAQSGTYSNILWGLEKAVDTGEKRVFNGILYTESGASFGSYYESKYGSWGGFALSSNRDLSDLGMDYSNQFSVYAPSASKFAIAYVYGAWDGEYGNPIIEFAEPVKVLYADVANANKTYNYCIAKPKVGAEGSQEDIWVNLIVTGYRSGAKTQDMTIELVKGTKVLADWTKYDFTSLGVVDKLTFTIDSNDQNEYGLAAPAFFCLDNIALEDAE